ncbi:MAG: DNA photolyase family protein [Bdellovibrionaceae bacterium]|nr:DNA photolyase family protein [Pseudobdellovibrionaceae bacterium]
MSQKYGLHWFRRDLRVAGNLSLRAQIKKHQGKVLGVFCFDKKFLSRKDFSFSRFQFFLHTLQELKKELNDLGGDLLVLDEGPDGAFVKIMNALKESAWGLPQNISWNRDYEPFAIQRDLRIKDLISSYEVEVHTYRDHLLIEPFELEKDQGQGYQVFTPFSKKWLSILNTDEIQKRISEQEAGIRYLEKRIKGHKKAVFSFMWQDVLNIEWVHQDILAEYILSNANNVTIEIPEAGSLVAYKAAKAFVSKINDYNKNRDFPNLSATSRLSIYLKNGSITVPQLIYIFGLQKGYIKKEKGSDVYLSELIWREFYYHILYRNPYVETKAFIPKYQNIVWGNDKKLFEAWKSGLTGFPIVDAGMRELNTTGFMHNRVRMIVASFLVKDLLIDWRWGEKYFMQQLLDGDLSANNGGWQWAASTGCDPQPYFRIFNPWLQSKKFDPEGIYIKQFVPELKKIPASQLHEPVDHETYPKPIVDHKSQKDKALSLYKKI